MKHFLKTSKKFFSTRNIYNPNNNFQYKFNTNKTSKKITENITRSLVSRYKLHYVSRTMASLPSNSDTVQNGDSCSTTSPIDDNTTDSIYDTSKNSVIKNKLQ